MSWPGVLAGSAAWLFLLVIPLVILYFLKLRRPRREWPSLALWRQVLNDQRVNSPFQKFKRNLLLLFQLLLLLAIILAALQPFWPSGAGRARRLAVLVDVSASMEARDPATGQTRLDAAKAKLKELIDGLLAEQQLAIIAVDDGARRLCDFTDNQRTLRRAVDDLTVSHVRSRLEDGLRMAEAMSRMATIEQALLYTDGNVPAEVDFNLPFQLSLQKLPPGGANVGITELNAQRRGDNWEIFVRVDGSPDANGLTELELTDGGDLLGRESVAVTSGQGRRVAIKVTGQTAMTLFAKITPDGADSLACDNIAYLRLPSLRPVRVGVDAELTSFSHAASSLANVELMDSANADRLDLCITEKSDAEAATAGVTLHIGVTPADAASVVRPEPGPAEVTDWQRGHPLFQHVQWLDVQIGDQTAWNENQSDRELEQAGLETLAHSKTGPLILQKAGAEESRYYFLFHTDKSSLPYRIAFPVLVANAVDLAASRAGLNEARALTTGVLPSMKVDEAARFQVAGPDGRSMSSVESTSEGVLAGIPARVAGRYEISGASGVVAEPVVSLLSESESKLETVDKLQFPELAVAADQATVKTDQPLWRWFAWAGLIFLLVEWFWFQRRPF